MGVKKVLTKQTNKRFTRMLHFFAGAFLVDFFTAFFGDFFTPAGFLAPPVAFF